MSEKFVNEGLKREKYGLNLKKNEEIDRRREWLAQKQGEKGKRASLESSVSREGGSVRWDADAIEKIKSFSGRHDKPEVKP
ncbi:MAG: hypothetical protein AAB595_01105 [Patescibacteria group bacterium]